MVSTVSHGNVLDNFDKRVNPMKTSPDSVGQSRDVPNAGSGSTPAGLEDVSSGCERSSTRQSGDTARFVAGTVRWWPTLLAPSDRLNSRLRPEWIDFDEAKGKKLGYAWNECHLKSLSALGKSTVATLIYGARHFSRVPVVRPSAPTRPRNRPSSSPSLGRGEL
jgi:hypothetical protein